MPNTIESVRIKGFRSLADMEIKDLPQVAVLIGANGSGKSNVIRFFEMMRWMLDMRRLGEFVGRHGGADDQLFGGATATSSIEAEIRVRCEEGACADYRFALAHTGTDQFVFSDEAYRFTDVGGPPDAPWEQINQTGHREAIVASATNGDGPRPKTARALVDLLRDMEVYQFHDTSFHSRLKVSWDVTDFGHLRGDGANLAAVLLLLEREDKPRLDLICRYITLGMPWFDGFRIEEKYGKVLLRWGMKGVDKTMGAHLTSDGMLRFVALVTLLNLPSELLPDVLLLDEPELGLHPAAVTVIGGMIKGAAVDRQVIVATQSPLLVDRFGLDKILVLSLVDGRTEINRFDPEKYAHWLDEYSTGELWLKNALGGRP